MLVHNFYEIKILDKDNKVVNKYIGYNNSDSQNFLKNGYIDKIVMHTNFRDDTKYLDNSNPGNATTYLYRPKIPYRIENEYCSEYMAHAFFNCIDGELIQNFKLYAGEDLISIVDLQDIDGNPIYIYAGLTNVNVTVNLFFTARIPIKTRNREGKIVSEINPIQYFQPSNSLLCGCCGEEQQDLLEVVTRRDAVITTKSIVDGYLPYPNNFYIGITKNPIPPRVDVSSYDIVNGGINNYEIVGTKLKTEEAKLKNKFGNRIKGLIRGLVFPGWGVIDLNSTEAKENGCLKQGILKGSTVKVNELREIMKEGNNEYNDSLYCYIPEEYIETPLEKFGTGFVPISMKRSPFYYANTVVVKRICPKIKEFIEGDNKPELGNAEIPIVRVSGTNQSRPSSDAFFSELNSLPVQRVKSYSQHIPLTDCYCGAETIIPCGVGFFRTWEGNTRKTTYTSHGYEIEYRGENVGRSLNEKYIAASYIVLGEYLTYINLNQDEQTTVRSIFKCTLEYSYDGNTFYTAFSNENGEKSEPYEKISFGRTIAAPIWRLKSNINSDYQKDLKNTTHSDPYISKISDVNKSGYDPLFIFIGYDNNKSLDTSAEYCNSEKAAAACAEAENITNGFDYKNTMELNEIIEFSTTVPYLYHSNDRVFISGELVEGKKKHI